MVKTKTTLWQWFRSSTAAGLVLLLVLVGWPPTAAAKIRSDWSKVQGVAPGTKTTVLLYEDQAPREKRKIKGQFQSATDESITLLLPDGQAQTLKKRAVRKVLVYRPFKERYQGWIAAGVGTTLFVPWAMSPEYDINLQWGLVLTGLFIGAPTVIAFLASPKWGGVYNVPRKLRDDAAPEPPPTATGQSSATSGSGLLLLEDKAFGPELLRSQTGQTLLWEKLLFDLVPRSVHEPRSGLD